MEDRQAQHSTRQSPGQQPRRFIYRAVELRTQSAHPMRRCTDTPRDLAAPSTQTPRRNFQSIDAQINIVATPIPALRPLQGIAAELYQREQIVDLSIDILA